ncbi:MAG: hypothetical protein MK233_00245 [Candidatus Poseidoniales archaeon]|jgi:hypothetical protein|nr:hypothetical protein [Candidatus Poseidoniales archaeon]
MERKTESGDLRDGTVVVKREWIVEYLVEISGQEPLKHLSILRGRDVHDVQARLYQELREEYPTCEKIEVTVMRLLPVEKDTDEQMFELDGVYQP